MAEVARAGLRARAEAAALSVTIAVSRRDLVERARADGAAGALRLGEFMLAANAIDAREEGRPFDRQKARALYAERLAALREKGLPAREAIPAVFGDLHYYGRPGGRMGDALLEGGGSCEPIAQLLAATLHDAGYPDQAQLRYYGGGEGITHLAPVWVEGASEHDLLTGGAAHVAGTRFSARDLVEIYARAHGLAEPAPSGSAHGGGDERAAPAGAADSEAAPPQSTLAKGYPPNHDRYPGAVPLYQSRAVHEANEAPAAASAFLEAREQAADCAFFVRMSVLDPPTLGVEVRETGEARRGGEGTARFPIEVHRIPSESQIDRTFSLIKAVEQTALSPAADLADRLMGLACLTALYDRAAVDFTFAASPDLARMAVEKRKRSAEDGAKLLARVDWAARDGIELERRLSTRFAGRSWLLLLLGGGDEAVLRLADRSKKSGWGRVDTLAALVVAPSTRARAVEIVGSLPRADQVDVMHEVFHAHDHLRPWSSNYALEIEGGARGAAAVELMQAYRVFRALAWGLWEGARPWEEVLSRVVREAKETGLDRAWVASFVDYYGRHALNLHQTRADYVPFSRGIRTWMIAEGYTDTEVFRTRLVEAI